VRWGFFKGGLSYFRIEVGYSISHHLQNANFFDFNLFLTILSRLPTSSGSREVYLLTFFLYEESLLRASILEESLNLYNNIHETKASRKTETLDRQRKIPSDMGIFQKRFIYLFFFENTAIISYSIKMQNFFLFLISASFSLYYLGSPFVVGSGGLLYPHQILFLL
jgi:hypothetical protein